MDKGAYETQWKVEYLNLHKEQSQCKPPLTKIKSGRNPVESGYPPTPVAFCHSLLAQGSSARPGSKSPKVLGGTIWERLIDHLQHFKSVFHVTTI